MGQRILIVDDAAFMRMMLKTILHEAGYEIVGEAGSGGEAAQKYQELKPDLVTMDITMPEMDGIEGVKKIHSLDSNAKIIMVSAMGQKTMVLEAMQSGAINFIVKPFDKDKVLETVKKAIGEPVKQESQ